jgi:hypothetical protein
VGVAVLVLATITAVTGSGVAEARHSGNRHPTLVTNHGAGPALVLKNRAAYPPLQVGSSVKVAGLNADQVDGLDSSQLEPATWEYRIGQAGETFSRRVTFAVPSGWYQATAHATAKTTDAHSHLASCYFFPVEGTLGPEAYANLIGDEDLSIAPQVSVAGNIFLPPNEKLMLDCLVADATEIDLLGPMVATLRPISTVPGPGLQELSGPMRSASPPAR